MNSAATSPRRKGPILLRRLRYLTGEAPRRVLSLSSPSDVETVGVLGANGAQIADAGVRLEWSLPDEIAVVASLLPGQEAPGWAGEDAGGLPARVEEGDPGDSDILLIADARWGRWLRRMHDRRAMIGDQRWYSAVEVETYASLSSLTTTVEQWSRIRQGSQRVMADLLNRFEGAEQIAVYGTGPSMTSIDPSSLHADVTIACNSAVSNLNWLAAARPAVIAFADPVFHFGPSRYAAQFRSDLRRVVEETAAVFLVPERFAPLLLRRIPELEGRLIAVEHDRSAALTTLAIDRLVVPQTANVLTLLMLPMAAALGQRIMIAGCDGRRPTERYFWNHGKDVQYGDDLMASAFDAHPSFFRDRDYRSYYDEHCDQLEDMLTRAEDRGYAFVSATPSQIPALHRRAAG